MFYTLRDQKVLFLLGKEAVWPGFLDSGKWSCFGGKIEDGEPPVDAAAREAYEESMGMFGSESELRTMIMRCSPAELEFKATLYHELGIHLFPIRIKYTADAPLYFDRFCRYAAAAGATASNQCGMFEKTHVAWLSRSQLRCFANSGRHAPFVLCPGDEMEPRPVFRATARAIVKWCGPLAATR